VQTACNLVADWLSSVSCHTSQATLNLSPAPSVPTFFTLDGTSTSRNEESDSCPSHTLARGTKDLVRWKWVQRYLLLLSKIGRFLLHEVVPLLHQPTNCRSGTPHLKGFSGPRSWPSAFSCHHAAGCIQKETYQIMASFVSSIGSEEGKEEGVREKR